MNDGVDYQLLDSSDLAGLKQLYKRLEGSKNLKLPADIEPYIDVEGSIKEQEENIKRYIEYLKRKSRNRKYIKNNLVNEKNYDLVKDAVEILDRDIKLYSENYYILPANELDRLGEYKILDYYNLRPYVGKELSKPIYAKGYEPKE